MVGREGVHGRGNSIEVALKAEALGRRDDVTLLLLPTQYWCALPGYYF
jgi:hypothetical protein